MIARLVRLGTILGGVACAVVLIYLIASDVPVVQRVGEAQEWMASHGMQGAVLFPLFYALCNILLLPAGILSIGAGFFFGLWWGFFLVLCGNVLSAAAAFLISRAVGRKRFERLVLSRPRWAALDAAIAREGWKIIILSQVHPLFPTSLITYLYGITRMGFWPCMLWVAIGQAPGRFFYAYLGTLAQLGIKLHSREEPPAPVEYVVWGGGLVLSLVITIALGRIAMRLLREMGAAGEAAPAEQAKGGPTESERPF